MSAPRPHTLEGAADSVQPRLREFAARVDRDNRFPHESISALRGAGLLGFRVPERLGGSGGSFGALWRIGSALGAGCASTGLIWAMHCQQVFALTHQGVRGMDDILRAIARDQLLVGSVTSEHDGPGDLLSAQAPLFREGAGVRVLRRAPRVSYAAEADLLLVKMRAHQDAPPSDVRWVLVGHDDGLVTVEGGWDALGMRGTRTVPVTIDATVDAHRVLDAPAREVALASMLPAGHLAWAAVWFGAAYGAYRRFVPWLRRAGSAGRRNLDSDLTRERLAELRLTLDLIEAQLERTGRHLDELAASSAPPVAYEDASLRIRLNNVKIAAAELAYRAADMMVELAGVEAGYLCDGELGLEQLLRDLRSASLMYSNSRLRLANGALVLVEGTGLGG